jgi:hypothetical protein
MTRWKGLMQRTDTSAIAEEKIRPHRETLEDMVLSVIRGFGSRGCISDDVREAMAREGVTSYSSVTARFKALADAKLIYFTGETRPGNTGRPQRVMAATWGGI